MQNEIKCPNCKAKISTSETVQFVGTATVHGETSIRHFHYLGIEWSVNDSENEQIICPKCKEPFDIPTIEE